jgi:hypothetical protein
MICYLVGDVICYKTPALDGKINVFGGGDAVLGSLSAIAKGARE